MVAKCWLTSTLLVSGHKCSAGCSSGEKDGGGGREEVQRDVVGHTQAQTGVPSGTIQHDPAPAQSSSWG